MCYVSQEISIELRSKKKSFRKKIVQFEGAQKFQTEAHTFFASVNVFVFRLQCRSREKKKTLFFSSVRGVQHTVVGFISFIPPWICQSLVIHTISFALPQYDSIHIGTSCLNIFRTLHFRRCCFFHSRYSLVGSFVVCLSYVFFHRVAYTLVPTHISTNTCAWAVAGKLCVAIFLGERARSSHCFAVKSSEVDDVFCRFSFHGISMCVCVCFPHSHTRTPIHDGSVRVYEHEKQMLAS